MTALTSEARRLLVDTAALPLGEALGCHAITRTNHLAVQELAERRLVATRKSPNHPGSEFALTGRGLQESLTPEPHSFSIDGQQGPKALKSQGEQQ